MKTVNMRVVLVLLASLASAGCVTTGEEPELSVGAGAEAFVESASASIETEKLAAPEPGDLLAKARAIAASKGLGSDKALGGGTEGEALARAALAPLAGDGAPAAGNPASDAQAVFQRAAMRFAAQGGGASNEGATEKTRGVTRAEKFEANDPREIFRRAQALVRERALADSRAFGALAPAQTPVSNPQTYFVEAIRMRQQQSALALGPLGQ